MMKSFKIIFLCLSAFVAFVVCQGNKSLKIFQLIAQFIIEIFLDCGENARYVTVGYARQFQCSNEGVKIFNNVPGCSCNNFDNFYNLDTKTCSEVNCENLNCIGKTNEAFFARQSSSRDRCVCSIATTRDSRTGCMCKNGK